MRSPIPISFTEAPNMPTRELMNLLYFLRIVTIYFQGNETVGFNTDLNNHERWEKQKASL